MKMYLKYNSRRSSRKGQENTQEDYDQSLYKTTWRNINIALLPNYAVGKSYNGNQIIFYLILALGKSISYFDCNLDFSLNNHNSIKNIVRFQYNFQITLKSYNKKKERITKNYKAVRKSQESLGIIRQKRNIIYRFVSL